MSSATLALLAGLLVSSQVPREPARDLFLHSARVHGVEVRFVDYHWQPELFEAMASGTSELPEAKRNWVLARVILDERPRSLRGTRIPVGNYALALWPNLDGKGMQIELRRVDMREVYPKLDAMAEAPRGETVYKGPAGFEKLYAPSDRLDVTLRERAGAVALTILYGDRRLPLTLER